MLGFYLTKLLGKPLLCIGTFKRFKVELYYIAHYLLSDTTKHRKELTESVLQWKMLVVTVMCIGKKLKVISAKNQTPIDFEGTQ